MSVIDRKVVEMKFDNSQFEQGVSQSLKSIENLEQGIDQATNKPLAAKGLEALGNSVDKIASKFSMLGVLATTAMAKLSNTIVNKVSSVITAVPNQIIQGGLTRALNLEQARFQFQGLGIDVEKAMASVNAAVKGTAYGLDEAATIASQLTASGIQVGDDMTTTLKGVAGVAAMTNSSFGDIGRVFTQVAGAGRLYAQDMLQLSSRGLNVAAVLGQQLGKTEAEIREMVSKGQIDFRTFSDAMANAFGDQATKANETYTGSLSNLKAALSRIGADVQTEKLVVLRDLFNALTPQIDIIHEKIKPLSDGINALMHSVGEGIIPAINSFDPKPIENLAIAFKEVIDEFLKVDVAGAFQNVFPDISASPFAELTEHLKWLAEGFDLSGEKGEALKGILTGVFGIVKIGESVILILAKAFFAVLDAASPVLTFLGNFGNKIGEFSNAIFDIAKSGNALEGPLNNVRDVITKVIDALNMGISTTDKLSVSIQDIGAGFAAQFLGIWDNAGAVNYAMNKTTSAFDSFKGAEEGVSTVSDEIQSTFSEMNDGASELASTMASGSNIFQTAGDKINSLNFAGLLNTGMLAGIAVAISKFLKYVKKIPETLDKAFDFRDRIQEVFDGVTGSLDNLQKSIKANVILKIAAAIALMAVALKLMADIETTQLFITLGGMAILLGELAGAIAIFSVIANKLNPTGLTSMSASLILLGGAILVFTLALKILADIPILNLAQALGALVIMLGALAGFVVILAKFGSVMNKAGTGLLKAFPPSLAFSMILLAGAFVILAAGLKLLEGISWNTIAQAGVILAGFLIVVTGFVVGISLIAEALKKHKKSMMGIGELIAYSLIIVALAASLLLIANAMTALGSLSWEDVAKGLAAIVTTLAALTATVTLMKGGSLWELAQIGGSITAIAEAFKILADIDEADIIKGCVAISTALLIIVTAMWAFKTSMKGIDDKKFALSLGVLVIAIAALTSTISILAKLSIVQLAKSIIAFGSAIVILGIACEVLSKNTMNQGAKNLILLSTSLVIIAAAINILVPALILLSIIPLFQLAGGLAVMIGMIVALSLTAKALAPCTMALKDLGFALLEVGAAIALVGLGAAAFVAAISIVGNLTASALQSIRANTMVLLDMLPEMMVKIAAAITVFIIELGKQADAIVSTGVKFVIAFLDGCIQAVPHLADLVYAIIVEFLAGLGENMEAITKAGMDIVIGLINGIAAKMGDLIDAGINLIFSILEGMAKAIPTVISKIFDLIGTIISSILQALGESTSRIIEVVNQLLGGIFDFIKEIVQDAILGIALILQGLVDVFNSVFSGIADVLRALSDLITKPIYAIRDLIVDVIQTSADAFTQFIFSLTVCLKELADIPSDDIAKGLDAVKQVLMDLVGASWSGLGIFGGSIKDVGEGLASMGWAMEEFSKYSEGFPEHLRNATSALENLDLSKVKEQYQNCGDSLGAAADSFKTVTDSADGLVDATTKISTGITNMKDEIINSSNTFDTARATITDGISNIVTTAEDTSSKMTGVGEQITHNLVVGLENTDVTSLTDAGAKLVNNVLTAAESVPTDSFSINIANKIVEGMCSVDTSDRSKEFGIKIVNELSNGLTNYNWDTMKAIGATVAGKLADGFSDADTNSISTKFIEKIVNTLNTVDVSEGGKALGNNLLLSVSTALEQYNWDETFKPVGGKLAEGIKNGISEYNYPELSEKVTNNLTNSLNAIDTNKITEPISKNLTSSIGNISAKEEAKKVGQTILEGIKDVDYTSPAKDKIGPSLKTGVESIDLTETGRKIAEGFCNGIRSVDSGNAGWSLGRASASGADSTYHDHWWSGNWVGGGFSAGIWSKWGDAYDAGYALGKAAKQGEANATQEGSPAKEFIKSGRFIGDGLVIGIKDKFKMVYKSGESLGESAINGVNTTISALSNILEKEIDDDLTITPVVDLSNVNKAANHISNQLGKGSYIYNAKAIATMQNRIPSSAEQFDNAVNKLNDILSSQPTNTYNYSINGITYDDGTNIHNAVGELIRATRIARRV